MKAEEQTQIRNGKHWLCDLCKRLELDPVEEIDEIPGGWDMTAADAALEILELAFPPEIVREAKLTIRCWPYEKKLILMAANGRKVEDFIREALIEKAMKEIE